MKTTWLLASLATVMLISLAPAQRPTPSPTTSATGRYQFQSLIIDENDPGKVTDSPVHIAFLVDTETGQIWRFQPQRVATEDGKEIMMRDILIPVDRETPHAQ